MGPRCAVLVQTIMYSCKSLIEARDAVYVESVNKPTEMRNAGH